MIRSNLLCIFLFTLLLLFGVGGWGFLHVGEWLYYTEQPVKADVIVCLSAGKNRVIKAADLYRKGFAGKVLVTSEYSAHLMSVCGVPVDNIMQSADGRNTLYEALQVEDVLAREKYRSAIVVSNPYHMNRVRWVFDHLLVSGSVRFTFVASGPDWADGPWWKHKENREIVLREVPANIYYRIVHGLLGIRQNPQWVLDLEESYTRMLDRFL